MLYVSFYSDFSWGCTGSLLQTQRYRSILHTGRQEIVVKENLTVKVDEEEKYIFLRFPSLYL